MELKDAKIGEKFSRNGVDMRPIPTPDYYDNVCISCCLYNRDKKNGQCPHLKECSAFSRPDKRSVVFVLESDYKEHKEYKKHNKKQQL